MIYKYNIIKYLAGYINHKFQEYKSKDKTDLIFIEEREGKPNLVSILLAGHNNPIVYESNKSKSSEQFKYLCNVSEEREK